MVDIWGNFTNGTLQYAIDAYHAIDPWFFPLLFVGIIGYVYTAMNSAVTAAVAIIITFGLFAISPNLFQDTPELNIFLYLIVIIGITLLIVTLILKERGE